MKIVAFAGGVGGAKLVDGLAQLLTPQMDLTAIVNTGDDFEHYGLHVCPDLDTVCYTLAGLANNVTGWGRAGETWHVLGSLRNLEGPDWFQLGDHDLGTHLERTRRLGEGEPLSRVTSHFCRCWNVKTNVLPMSDDKISTIVSTVEMGELPFQEYFVKHRCRPSVKGFRFAGIETAKPAPGVLEAIEQADYVILCPSNPWVSIDPILALAGLREAVSAKTTIAISPLIGGSSIKGPAAKMYAELGISPGAVAVAAHYRAIITAFVLDIRDQSESDQITRWGIIPFVTDILMHDREDRKRLAKEILSFCKKI